MRRVEAVKPRVSYADLQRVPKDGTGTSAGLEIDLVELVRDLDGTGRSSRRRFEAAAGLTAIIVRPRLRATRFGVTSSGFGEARRMRVARRLVISGRVQGVGFRWFACDAAAREGVTGWVRNLPDGRVEAHVEGDTEAVTHVERALRRGPAGARVDHVEVDIEEPSGAYKDFSIT